MTSDAGQSRGGPLAGLKVLEFAGVGPTPMGAMMLADMGAEVVMIDRIEPVELGSPKTPGFDLLRRNRLKPQDITSMILIGGPTRTPFIRQVLQDRLELSLKDDVDPMTAVALGAAIYASTKEIPLELRRNGPVPAVNDAPGCVVKLEYEPSAREPMHFVAGRIVAADLCVGFSVDVRRSDGLWTSESIPVGEDGLFTTEILLVSGAGRILSRFETLVRDASGRIRARVPEPHVWYPMGETVMAVPNSLLVGLEDNRTFSLVAAGSALPLEVSKGPFFTTKSLAKGSGEDMLRIPILEGVTNHLGEENETADCNLHIGTLVIEGNDMKVTRDLPTGSEVELSIRVDASQRITVMAEIPHLDEEFPATFEHEATLSPLPALRSRFEGLQQEIQRMRNLETRHPQSEIRETLDRLDLIGVVSQIDTQLKRAEGSEVGTKEDAHEQVLKLAGTLHLVSKLQARARIEDLAASLAGLCPAEHQSELSDLRSTLASTPNEDHEGLKRLEASFHNLDLRIRTGPCLDLLLDIIAIGGKRITPAQNETLREAVKLGERFIESDGGRKLSRSEVEDMSRMHDKLMRAHPELPAWRNEKLASMGGDLSQAADQLRGSDLQC